jgi:formate hydrogenlyase subunit 3/multisubunit Na+/H+ antiporter MnhD subunit
VVKIISFSYVFILVLFLLCIINMGFPPFIGFLREILILKATVLYNLSVRLLVIGVLFSCYYNIYLFWCFNGFIGIVFKINFFRIDLFLFMLLVRFLNLY